MKLAVFSAKPCDKKYLLAAYAARYGTASDIQIDFYDFALCEETVSLMHDVDAVCVFVNDMLTAPVLEELHTLGVRAVLLRCANYNNVDLPIAERLGIFVANVPNYSPEAVAEFAVALILTLNRKINRAYNRARGLEP
jgi:D-lactate dehydrogenase